jgi:hypothetical protein
MDIAIYTLKSVAYTLTEPSLVIILVILGFVLYTQNKKTTVMQKMIIGERLSSPLELTLSQIVLGIFAGTVGSIILSYCGVIFEGNSGIELVFLVSVFLMFWNPRFICFAYSGAVLGFISFLFNDFPRLSGTSLMGEGFINIDITALMTVIGVLHIVEGLLVMFDGNRGAIPVFTNRDGKIIGGFALKRYWPIPIAVFIMLRGEVAAGGDMIWTPDWWPLIKSPYSAQLLKDAIITLAPFYAMLGYSSVTFTKDKSEKAVLSGMGIVLYGITLSFVAQLAAYGAAWKLFVLLFAPVAHELMLKLQKYMELNSKPRYTSEDDGIMVLEVAPGSPAFEMGIKSGDKLIEINDKKIMNESDIMDAADGAINYIWFKVRSQNGKEHEVNYTNLSRHKKLGVVFVPKGLPKDSMVVKFEEGKFKEMLDKFKNKDEDN